MGSQRPKEAANVTLKNPAPLFADVDGDGAKEALAFFTCQSGWRIPGDSLIVVRAGGEVVGSVSLDPVFHQDQVRGSAITQTSNGIQITVTGLEDSHGRVTFAKDQPSVAPISAPASPPISLKDATFTTDGFGPLKVGTPATDYPGYVNADATYDDDVTGPKMPSGLYALIDDGDRLSAVWTDSPRYRSRAGAHVGMLVSDLKKLYGNALTKTVSGTQSADNAWALEADGHSLLFFVDWPGESTITKIYVSSRPAGPIGHKMS